MVDFRLFRNRLTQLNKRVHGNYDPRSFPKLKRTVLGRFAAQFRSWVAESAANRFEPEQWDAQLQRNVKGYYRTIADIGVMETLRAYYKIALMSGKGLENLSPVDQANLKKSLMEVSAMLSILASGLMMMHLADDDDDEKFGRVFLINQLNRLQNDMTFFVSPSSFNNILSNPAPAIKTYLDAEKAIGYTFKYVLQDAELDGKAAITNEELAIKIAKAFPIINQVNKLSSQGEKVFIDRE